MNSKALKAIFSSGTRVKLMSHFFLNPGSSFYVRQLEKMLKTSVGQLRRELVNLEKAGFLMSSMAGNLRQYMLNREFIIYNELKSIFLKTASVGDVIKDCLSGMDKAELAFVYGSYADGKAHTGSDIDVMIVGQINAKELHRAVASAEKRLNRRIDYSSYTREEILGRLKSNDNFIGTAFKGPKILLKGNISDELFGAVK